MDPHQPIDRDLLNPNDALAFNVAEALVAAGLVREADLRDVFASISSCRVKEVDWRSWIENRITESKSAS